MLLILSAAITMILDEHDGDPDLELQSEDEGAQCDDEAAPDAGGGPLFP